MKAIKGIVTFIITLFTPNFNAAAAKEKALEIRSDAVQYKKIKQFIATAAANGQFRLRLVNLRPSMKPLLLADGFVIYDFEVNTGKPDEPVMQPNTDIIWGEEPAEKAKPESNLKAVK